MCGPPLTLTSTNGASFWNIFKSTWIFFGSILPCTRRFLTLFSISCSIISISPCCSKENLRLCCSFKTGFVLKQIDAKFCAKSHFMQKRKTVTQENLRFCGTPKAIPSFICWFVNILNKGTTYFVVNFKKNDYHHDMHEKKVFHSAALESISTNRGVWGHLFMGGTTSVHERTKKILGPPPWQHCVPPP